MNNDRNIKSLPSFELAFAGFLRKAPTSVPLGQANYSGRSVTISEALMNDGTIEPIPSYEQHMHGEQERKMSFNQFSIATNIQCTSELNYGAEPVVNDLKSHHGQSKNRFIDSQYDHTALYTEPSNSHIHKQQIFRGLQKRDRINSSPGGRAGSVERNSENQIPASSYEPSRPLDASLASPAINLNSAGMAALTQQFPETLISKSKPCVESTIQPLVGMALPVIDVKMDKKEIREYAINKLKTLLRVFQTNGVGSLQKLLALTDKWIIKTESKERPYKCGFQDCGESYKQRCHLKSHIFIHTGVSGYECNYSNCRSIFFQNKYTLRRHIRTRHTRERPYSCALCSAKFMRTDHLKNHMKTQLHQSKRLNSQ